MLTLCAPRRRTFSQLQEWYARWTMKVQPSPRVFLSYNQRTQARWVHRLSEFLKERAPDGKYIVVVRSNPMEAGLPQYLRGRLVIPCPSDEQTASVYQIVLSALYDEGAGEPRLGEPPVYL